VAGSGPRCRRGGHERALYIAEINTRRRTPDLPLLEAVVQGARVQFRPRLVLIVVAVLGMLPAALARGIGSDIQRPLATVVGGGLVATLIPTLLALPAIYVLAERVRSRGRAAA
jgi:cobalt-zinc-cadmium resistance protein CzcA